MDKSETSIIIAANKLMSQQLKKIKQPLWVTNEIKNLLHKRMEFKSDQENTAGYKKKSKSNLNVLRSSGWKKNVGRLRDSTTPSRKCLKKLAK